MVNNKQYDKLNAAYCYYNVSNRLTALMKDMLTVAKQQDFDVFNALDSMDNAEFLKVRFFDDFERKKWFVENFLNLYFSH